MSGPDPNALCIFPFEYNGEIFNECTDKEHDQMWCHTSEDWGNCGPDCTTSSGTPSSSTPMSISGKYLQLLGKQRGENSDFLFLGQTVRADIFGRIFLSSQKSSQMAAFVSQ